jgi:hypothetical protein
MGDMTTNISRRQALAGSGVIALAVVPAKAEKLDAASSTVLIEQTYLKANAGLKGDLRTFIEHNWFVMDQKGVEQGIFTSFWLMEDVDENGAWDFVMAVGYPQLEGYENAETKPKFDAISKAHVPVPVNGRILKDLGKIVHHHRLKVGGGNRHIGAQR